MATITTRSGKGSPLTNNEVDANFNNLNTDKLELGGGTLTGNLNFGDNVKATFGASDDLQIYHDGSRSYISDQGTGGLRLLTNEFSVMSPDESENLFFSVQDGSTYLYQNGSVKLQTTSTGIDVTGNVDLPDNGRLLLGAGDDLQIYHTGSASIVGDFGTGDLLIRGENLKLQNTAGENYLVATNNGATRLYYDNEEKLATTTTGINVTGTIAGTRISLSDGVNDAGSAGSESVFNNGGTTANFRVESIGNANMLFVDGGLNAVGIGTNLPSSTLHIKTSVDNSVSQGLVIERSANTDKGYINYQGGGFQFRSTVGDPIVFGDTSNEQMRLTSTGLGIGTSSPNQKLAIANNGTAVYSDAGFTNANSTSDLYMGVGGSAVSNTNLRNNAYVLAGNAGSNLILGTDVIERFRISADGSCRWTPDGTNHDMTLTASGTLLVGKTSADFGSTQGFEVRTAGNTYITASNVQALRLNRTDSDGNIAEFKKDNITVGSIGTDSNDLNINGGANHSGIRFQATGLYPLHNGTASSAEVDLGATGSKFKNLYLSSGVYLGGTGAANKLDDYEEGEFSVTFTPSTSGSITLQTGADTMLYNKVGRVVHCQGQINVQSIASAVGSSIAVNLPFVKLNTTDSSESSSGPVTYYNTSAYSVLPAYVPSSVTQAFNIVIDPSTLANGHRFFIQFSYTVD